MEEKNIALCILGVIAVIAIVGLILLFTAQQAGAKQMVEYPGGVMHTSTVYEKPAVGTGVGWKYSEPAGEPVVEPANIPHHPVHWKTVEGKR
ncbi:hypothetical protein GF343_01000 [Candidatus Woesearchaeota archaeon]|nr:hypothetical protein [Candidatus Woesearchaeota archaeon]